MNKQEFLAKLAAATNQHVAKEIRQLAETMREYVDADIEPTREQVRLMQDRLDHAEARLAELEAARPQGTAKLRQIR